MGFGQQSRFTMTRFVVRVLRFLLFLKVSDLVLVMGMGMCWARDYGKEGRMKDEGLCSLWEERGREGSGIDLVSVFKFWAFEFALFFYCYKLFNHI